MTPPHNFEQISGNRVAYKHLLLSFRLWRKTQEDGEDRPGDSCVHDTPGYGNLGLDPNGSRVGRREGDGDVNRGECRSSPMVYGNYLIGDVRILPLRTVSLDA